MFQLSECMYSKCFDISFIKQGIELLKILKPDMDKKKSRKNICMNLVNHPLYKLQFGCNPITGPALV
jgi:hypothetical protein